MVRVPVGISVVRMVWGTGAVEEELLPYAYAFRWRWYFLFVFVLVITTTTARMMDCF